MIRLVVLLAFTRMCTAEPAPARVVETIVPALAYNSSCSSTVSVRNTSSRSVAMQIQGRRSDGALVGLRHYAGTEFVLRPGEVGDYQLSLTEDAGDAWVKVREQVPRDDLLPALAVSGVTECVSGSELLSAERRIAYAIADPWLSEASGKLAGETVLVVNLSEKPAGAHLCESSGGYYALPSETRGPPRVRPICDAEVAVQIVPFGTHRFQIDASPDKAYLLETRGNQIVMQVLRPLNSSVQLYTVDSNIRFGQNEEAH